MLQPIDVNDPKYFCVQDGKKRKLRVANVSSKDEGFYKCKVQDKVTSAKLYVARKSIQTISQMLICIYLYFAFICIVVNTWYSSEIHSSTNCAFI